MCEMTGVDSRQAPSETPSFLLILEMLRAASSSSEDEISGGWFICICRLEAAIATSSPSFAFTAPESFKAGEHCENKYCVERERKKKRTQRREKQKTTHCLGATAELIISVIYISFLA